MLVDEKPHPMEKCLGERTVVAAGPQLSVAAVTNFDVVVAYFP